MPSTTGPHLFQPGQSGNPAGRPKGARSFTTKVREALMKIADGKDYTNEAAFIRSILKKAIEEGDASTQKLIWNYLDGLPHQTVDTTVEFNPKPLLDVLTENNHVRDNNGDEES